MRWLILLIILSCSSVVEGREYVYSCEYKDRQTTLSAITCNLYFEARSHREGVVGLYAVAFNTLNRVKSERFPDSAVDVVYQRGQYEWTDNGKSDRVYDLISWKRCLRIAKIVLSIPEEDYNFYDITKGSLFYHSNKVSPYWAAEEHLTVVINNHIYYSNDKKK